MAWNEQQAIDCFTKATIGSSEPQQAFFTMTNSPTRFLSRFGMARIAGKTRRAVALTIDKAW